MGPGRRGRLETPAQQQTAHFEHAGHPHIRHRCMAIGNHLHQHGSGRSPPHRPMPNIFPCTTRPMVPHPIFRTLNYLDFDSLYQSTRKPLFQLSCRKSGRSEFVTLLQALEALVLIAACNAISPNFVAQVQHLCWTLREHRTHHRHTPCNSSSIVWKSRISLPSSGSFRKCRRDDAPPRPNTASA